VQRLPVKIVLEPGQRAAQLLKVGMSVTPTVICEDGRRS
jgi:membrane fusion protein (multidrug efflux system)